MKNNRIIKINALNIIALQRTEGDLDVRVAFTPQEDFLQSLTSASSVSALNELMWNALDAQSEKLEVDIETNLLGGIQCIRVRDWGSGIAYDDVEKLFGNLGDSWKRSHVKQPTQRVMHGKNGKGRFKAFALGDLVEWRTVFKQPDGHLGAYQIRGDARTLNGFEVTEPQKSKAKKSGTEVVIHEIRSKADVLLKDHVHYELTKNFAVYLARYPNLSITYCGRAIDPSSAQKFQKKYTLNDIEISEGRKVCVELIVIEWLMSTDRELHLCDADGISLHKVQPGIQAPEFDFTAYIQSSYFRELDKTNELGIAEMHPDVLAITKVAKEQMREHFKCRRLEMQELRVEGWKRAHIYPYDDNVPVSEIEKVERKVFDILAVNVENNLPSFGEADHKSKKLTFQLLSKAIQSNPDSVQKIIGEILELKKAEQDDLAKLLTKTPLSSIISLGKTVANRLDFLQGLEDLLFHPETKAALLERDQLHKLLESQTWLFHEEFALAASEVRLEKVLEKHLALLRPKHDQSDTGPVLLPDGRRGRLDLLLRKVIQPRTGEFDYLVVELKRPSQKIDEEVLRQVDGYANAVASDERFQGVNAKWTFLTISNEITDSVARKANQKEPKGRVYDYPESNVTVWVKTWAGIINDARSRLRFAKEQLDYSATQEDGRDYLEETYAKLLPTIGEQHEKVLEVDVPEAVNE